MTFPSRRAPGLLALLAALAGCTPPAGMAPWPPPAAPPAAPAAVAASLAPAPSAAPARVGAHLVGVVSADGAPVVGARMRFVDLETGKAIAPLEARLAETDAQGRFDYLLPRLSERQVVKVVATAGARTYVTLVDGRGRTLQPDRTGATDPLVVARAGAYALAQAGGTLTVQLRLSSASSAVAKAFEGTVKFQFQLSEDEGGLQRALERAQALVEEVGRLIAGANEAALAETLDPSGEISQLDRFRAVLGAAGASDELLAGVTELVGFFKPPSGVLGAAGSQDPITTEDFPLGDISITREGAFSFTGSDGETIAGSFAEGVFVPNQDLPPPDEPPDEPPENSSSGGGGAPSPDPSPEADGGLVFTDGTIVDTAGPEGLEPVP